MKLPQITIILLLIISVKILTGEIAVAQLQIAPTAIYMDEKNTTQRIIIMNISEESVEVDIELLFGYPSADEQGNVYYKHVAIDKDQPSAVEWIRIYPRFFILEPGARQTVRFAARPPGNLQNGEYWARPAIVAQRPSVINNLEGNKFATQLNLRNRTIIALNYRKGAVRTGIILEDLLVELVEGEITITVQLHRLGNAAYLGHYEVIVADSYGYVLKSEKKEIAIYNNQMRAFRFNSYGLTSGQYNVELNLFTTERRSNGIIQAPPSTATASFIIP